MSKKDSSSSSSSSPDSSSSSKFRVTKTATGPDKLTQARMIRWCEEHPGKTARNLLQHMENQVGRDGENMEQGNSLPAAAKAYDLRVLKIQPGANHHLRNHREITTLCVVLDHLAQGRVNQAADCVASRLKAVEQTSNDGNWENSRYLELLPADIEGLTTKDEKQMVCFRDKA